MGKLVILDRDGVINEDSDDYIKSVDEWIPIPGSLEAISRLTRAGYRVAVATNQSGIARGLYDLDSLQAMHEKMTLLLAQRGSGIDGIFYCPHGPDEGCNCRKPKPGLLLQIGKAFNVPLNETYFVGDSRSDVLAAKTVGAKPALVRTGKGQRTLDNHGPFDDVPVYDDLAHFVRVFLSHEQ